jgi:hypothetical protein
VALAALDFLELGQHGVGGDIAGNRLALGIEPKPADALAVGRDAIVGDEAGHVTHYNVRFRGNRPIG